MADAFRQRHILWQCARLSSTEYATLTQRVDGSLLTGVVLMPLDGVPCRLEYDVDVDEHWRTRSAVAVITTPLEQRHLRIEAHDAGAWSVDDAQAPQLDGCTDVDLGWTPATNTLPIRRLRLEAGQSTTINAAWVRFPGLDVVASAQRYTRLAEDRWRYESGRYDFELVTDPPSGLVLAYGDDLWRAVGRVSV